MWRLFTNWSGSSRRIAELEQAIRAAQDERAALLRSIDEAVRARREAEHLLAESMFAFMVKVQQVRREARIASEEIGHRPPLTGA